MIFKKLSLSILFLSFLFSLTGCTIPFTDKEITLPFFGKSTEEVVDLMRENMDSLDYYKLESDVNLDLKVDSEKIKELIPTNGLGFFDQFFNDLSINFKLKNQVDQKNEENSKKKNNVNLEVLFRGGQWLFDFDSISAEEKQYFKINKFPMILSMFLNQFLGEGFTQNWIEFDYKEFEEDDFLENIPFYSMFDEGFLNSLNEDEIAEIDNLIEKYDPLRVEDKLDDEKIDGNNCYHYKIKIDQEQFKKFLNKSDGIIQKSNDNFNREKFASKLSEIVSQVDMDFWIDKKDFYLRKIKFNLRFDVSQLEIPDIDISEGAVCFDLGGEVKYYDFNKPVDIEKPENSMSIFKIIEEQAKKVKEELKRARIQARSAKTLADVKQIQTALEVYYAVNGKYPSLVVPGGEIVSGNQTFMRNIPSSAIDEMNKICSPDFDYIYGLDKEGNYKFIYCLESETSGISAGYHVAGLGGVDEKSLNKNEVIQVLSDFDNDGLCNYIETEVYKTDPMKKDSDGDGYNDKDELKNGYNPNGEGKL